MDRQINSIFVLDYIATYMRHFRLLALLFFIGQTLGAQTIGTTERDDERSPDTASVYYFHATERWPGQSLQRLSDTLLTGLQFFDPIKGSSMVNGVNGNIGLAYESFIFDFDPGVDFRFTPYSFDLYRLGNKNIKYYHVFGPFTNVFYSFGGGKSQLFSITHTQNITKGFSAGIDLNIINSLGLYNRQKSDNVSVAIQVQYVSPGERYAAFGNFHSNRFRWRENGGISSDSLFTENIETDRKRIPIWLQSADNQLKENAVFIRQFYYIGRNPGQRQIQESTGDSTIKDSIPRIRPSLPVERIDGHRYFNPERTDFFSHTFKYNQHSYLYKDQRPTSGFYQFINRDSINTYDSTAYHEFINELSFEGGIGRARGSGKALLLKAGIEHALTIYKNDTVKRTFNRVTTFGYLSANAFGVAKAEGYLWLTTGAPFNGDKGISAKLTLPAFDNSQAWGNLSVSLSLHAQQPDYMMQYHSGNHFAWENTFGQQNILSTKANYRWRYLSAGVNFYNLDGWVYLDENSFPARAGDAITVSQIYGFSRLPLGGFTLEAFGVWQKTNRPALMPLPELAGRVTAYHQISLFKRALHFQGGVSLLYNTAFYANAYMPALRSYYLQQTVETGNYPYLDVFVNLRVKRARIFVVMEHVNSGLNGYDYFMVPNYPMPDRSFRFGVTWMFYD